MLLLVKGVINDKKAAIPVLFVSKSFHIIGLTLFGSRQRCFVMNPEVGSSKLGSTMTMSWLMNDEKQSPREPAYDMRPQRLRTSVLSTDWFGENCFLGVQV